VEKLVGAGGPRPWEPRGEAPLAPERGQDAVPRPTAETSALRGRLRPFAEIVAAEHREGRGTRLQPSERVAGRASMSVAVAAPLPRAPARSEALAEVRAFARAHALAIVLCGVFLAGVLCVATARGAFFDEAIYLVAGRTLVFRGENWHYETWFVGSPFAFPVLAGVIERLGGGLAAVRLLNVGFLLGAVAGVYGLGRALRLSVRAAVLGAAAFGFSGSVLFTGSFATYDMPSLAATVAAFWLLARSTHEGRPRYAVLAAAGTSFAVAIIVKYIVIAVLPVLVAFALVRLAPPAWPWARPARARWRVAAVALGALLTPMVAIDGLYLWRFWWQLRLVLLYSGGHTTNYGATGPSILVAILCFVAPAWLLAFFGFDALRARGGRALLTGAVLVLGSLVMPLYHIWEVDPLALFKQMGWSLALLAPLDGIALAALSRRWREFTACLAVLAALALSNVRTLQAFYPDTAPPARWLQEHVHTWDAPLLVDDVWPYRLALAETFAGREWWVADQWWWQNKLATPALWRSLIEQGTFSYVVFERGGAFNGYGSVFDSSVVQSVEQSGRYRLVASFPSAVTWGNSILPPPFRGQLAAFSEVQTEIWQRVE